jgi:hypothetical protein
VIFICIIKMANLKVYAPPFYLMVYMSSFCQVHDCYFYSFEVLYFLSYIVQEVALGF